MTGPSYIEFGSVPSVIQIVFHRFKMSIRRIFLIVRGRRRWHVLHLEPAVPRITYALTSSLIMINKDVSYPVRVLDFLTWYNREGAVLS